MKKVRVFFKDMKLRQRIFFYTACLLALFCIAFLYFIFSANEKIVLNQIYTINQENSEKIEDYFDHLDRQISSLVRHLERSINLRELLNSGVSSNWSVDALVGDVANRNYVSSLDVYQRDGTLLSSSRDIWDTTPLSQEILDILMNPDFKEELYWKDTESAIGKYLTVYAPLNVGVGTKGIVKVTILPELLTGIYNYTGFNITSQICVLNGQGRRVIPEEMSSSEYVITQTAYRKFTEEGISDSTMSQSGDTIYLYCSYLEKYDIYVVHNSRSEDVMDMVSLANSAAIIMAVFALILFFIFANVIVHNISRPVTELTNVMSQVAAGDLEQKVSVDRNDEFGVMARTYNTMLSRINDLIRQNEENQRTQRRLELDALQMQITPHFLYNTLESFSSLALIGENETAFSMSSALSGFYRHVLSDGRNVIRLSEELEMVRNYLIIQSIRYSEKFAYEINVEEELLDSSIVKLTLQPLVENAIYHGIREASHKGLIEILGRKVGDGILLSVRDNGKGMDPEKWKIPNPKSKGGVGLSNVDQRLKLYFGEKYGIFISSVLGEGTTVDILLPNLAYGGDMNDFSFNRR